MRVIDQLDAFGRGDQHQCLDVFAAFAFQQADGGDQRTAGGKHRVDNPRRALVHFAGKFFKIGNRLQRFLVALQADDADFRRRNQVKHTVEHTQPGAQDGDDGQRLAGDAPPLNLAAPALQRIRLARQFAAGFIRHQPRQFARQRAEVVAAAIGLA